VIESVLVGEAQLRDKIERYSLKLQHPKGKDKAILFRKCLGVTLKNKQLLQTALLAFAIDNEAIIYKTDPVRNPV